MLPFPRIINWNGCLLKFPVQVQRAYEPNELTEIWVVPIQGQYGLDRLENPWHCIVSYRFSNRLCTGKH